jgi:hypothetical protein
MRNLPVYEQWLNERSKAVEYFRAHPDQLSRFAGKIPQHKKREYDATDLYRNAEWQAKEKIYRAARTKLAKIGGDDTAFEIKQSKWTYADLLTGEGPKDGGEWYSADVFRETIMKSKTFEDFFEVAADQRRLFRYPFETYNKEALPEEEPLRSLYRWMKTNYREIQAFCKWLDVAFTNIKGLNYKKSEKEFMKLGLSINDVEVAMSYIIEWTSMSRKKLDPSVWDLLNKISVDEKTLPQYVYRGIFYDGAKIKDPVKWSKTWYPGAKPGVSQGKATSWTIDRKTAINFMSAQDFVKDEKGGYYMLLKWKVDPKLVIADLRNLPVDHIFWNQQELIVSPEARDYEVDSMIPGSEGVKGLKNFQNQTRGGQGGWGISKADFASTFMSAPYETLNPATRMEFKQIAKMTLGEFQKAYPKSRTTNNPQWSSVSMVIYHYVTKYCPDIRLISAARDEIKFRIVYTLANLDWSRNPKIESAYTDYKKDLQFNPFYGTKEITSNEGSIKLIDDDYYNMDIEVNLPTSFSVQTSEGKVSNTDRDIESDKGLEKIFNKLGAEIFIDDFKTTQLENQKTLTKNIQIGIK